MADLALIGDALVRAIPLILTGLAVALAFRAGVLNLGAEGQLLVGATVATLISTTLTPYLGYAVIAAALIGGGVAGAIWAGIAAELKRRFRVLEIISTIMLNFIAIHLVSFLVRGPMQEPMHIYPQTESIHVMARLPVILPGTRLHAGLLVAIVAAVALQWLLTRTAVGFRIRVMGAGPKAAETAGRVDVERLSWRIFLVSGAIAGIAGAIEVSGVTFALYENISPGYGYTAIAVALIAALNPIGVIVSGVFFGALETGALVLQRDFAIPSSIASMAEASLILATLLVASLNGRPSVCSRTERVS